MPAMPEGRRGGHSQGALPLQAAPTPAETPRAQLLGSGAILREVLRAQELLEEKFGVAADVWSVTSYRSCAATRYECERWNMLHPGERAARAVRARSAWRSARAGRRGVATT